MGDVTITLTQEQEDIFREMGVKDFGLPIDCTAEDVLMFIVENNTENRKAAKLNEQWNKLTAAEKAAKLKD